MSKMKKVVLGAVAVWAVLTVGHLWLNLGMNPFKRGVEEETRFRVGFLPVT